MDIGRRSFLKQAGLFSIGLLPGHWRNVPSPARPHRCVIVGAGLAGLAAAYSLRQAGWEVTLLEARNRIGGRVFSYALPENRNLICELGAEWIGESHERIRAYCQEFGLPLQLHRFSDHLLRNGVFSRPGQWSYSPAAKTAWEELLRQYPHLTDEQRREIDRLDWWTFLERKGFPREDLLLREFSDSTDFGESIRCVSALAALAEYAESSEHNEMDYKLVGGNSRLIDEFTKRIGQENLRTRSKVTKIQQAAGLVTVHAGTEQFPADACICTIPTAALGRIEFDPPLSAGKRRAIDQLRYARIIKSSILYSERFWRNENFSMISDTTSQYFFHSTQNQPGVEGILTSYAVGDKADVLASQDNSRRQALINRDLMDCFPQAARLARGIASYAWQTDEYTAGAYALYGPGQWYELRPLLQEPHGKVLFAGEHLADWQGFMEGAIETGEAAAASLLGD